MVSLSTPSFAHLKEKDFENVYEPAEDTFLMMDALEKDYKTILESKPLICVEIGPGSGVLITFLASIVQDAYYIASDINDLSSYATLQTGQENHVNINTITDNLMSSLTPRLAKKVDVLLFNPPYVVTPSGEVGGTQLSAAWAGGIDGREVIDNFLPVAVTLLSDNGLLYLLLLAQNKPDEIMSIMASHGFHSSVILKRKAGPEYLSVVRFSKSEIS